MSNRKRKHSSPYEIHDGRIYNPNTGHYIDYRKFIEIASEEDEQNEHLHKQRNKQ